ncbi:hypothetical protein, partial [Pelagibius sp. Alg239-R121]|uniref:hypothetical protein n=1 Tax=Pelagibius sp. Alg239-R121 TaxID=2993448 RepID=UPI0024A6D204
LGTTIKTGNPRSSNRAVSDQVRTNSSNQTAGLSNSIHSVLRSDNAFSIDFGSSASVAISELLESLEQLGAHNIHVFGDRAEDE